MGFMLNTISAMFHVLLLLCAWPFILCSGKEEMMSSKAAYFHTPDGLGTPNGACGYGDYGRTVNYGNVAVVSSSKLYRGGAGCGACYQVRCKEPECNEDGVVVVVTDNGGGPDTAFILSTHAFEQMAKPGYTDKLKVYGKVDIGYKRVPCKYPGKNLMIKIGKDSRLGAYLALQFWYQDGASDITAVELFDEATIIWKPMRRGYGGVWEISNPPKGSKIRIFLVGSGTMKARWVTLSNVIPTNWISGATYDTHIHLED